MSEMDVIARCKVRLSKAGEDAVLCLLEVEDSDDVVAELIVDDTRLTETGVDAFEAISRLRLSLESEGLRLAIEASRLRSYPSAMSRSMGDGLAVYRLELGRPARTQDLRHMLDQIDPDEVASVAAQRAFYEEWLSSLR